MKVHEIFQTFQYNILTPVYIHIQTGVIKEKINNLIIKKSLTRMGNSYQFDRCELELEMFTDWKINHVENRSKLSLSCKHPES